MNNQFAEVTKAQIEQIGRSRSGMSRKARILGLTPARIVDLTEHVARYGKLRYNPVSKTLTVGGCGFSLVDHLASRICHSIGRDVPIERI